MFFQNIELFKTPLSRTKVIFQCDENYFKDYGFYNLLSCNDVGQDVHIHLINVHDNFIKKILELDLKIDLSISLENVNTNINFYKLKSYYFTSRFFITDYLFKKDLIDTAYITDADIIFNEPIILENINLGVLFYPQYSGNLWKQTGANFLLVRKPKQDFIERIIQEYNTRISVIDFETIHLDMPKYERANLYALDQVCMSVAMQSEDIESSDFLNLTNIEKFIGNKDISCKIWSLTAKKNDKTKKILFDRFMKSF